MTPDDNPIPFYTLDSLEDYVLDGDSELECIVPDSSPSKRSKGLAYLDWNPTEAPEDEEPVNHVTLPE